jgi:beta-mannosidase
MPGFKIYHQLIPKIIAELDPKRPYWPTTPFGEDPDPNAERSGNRHQWNIWSNWKDYSEVSRDQSLFVTEFGFQAPANRPTLEKYLPVEERRIQSPVFEFHNKQIEGNERLIRFLAGHLPISSSWADYIYLTQLNQGLALKQCIEHWRLRYPKTSGAIIWQLNDCWPVSSWSLIDWQGVPKLAYYFVKQAYSPVAVMAKILDSQLDFIVLNDSPEEFSGKMRAVLFENITGKVMGELQIRLRLKENSRKLFGNKFSRIIRKLKGWICVVSLYDQHNDLLHRNCYSNKRWKHLKLPLPEINFQRDGSFSQSRLLISTSELVLFQDFYHPQLIFSPRGLVLLPNEWSRICYSGSRFKDSTISKIKKINLNEYLQT